MNVRLIAPCLLAGPASAANAQTAQTIDGAQTFLVSVLPSAQIRLGGVTCRGGTTGAIS
jgi:hypothetical protein